MTKHAVISGAGIAGPALAHQLTARGWRTTVVERSPGRREEGHNIDVRGAAREVVVRMGIDADVRAANTGEVGMRLLDESGTAAAEFPVGTDGADGPTAELEILRGELSRILVDRTSDATDYRFGTQISDLADDGEQVTVTLTDGSVLDADLVVIAEGLRSRTRRYVTPAAVTDLGMYLAYLDIPRTAEDDNWWNWQRVGRGRSVHLRPDNLGTTRAILSFTSDVRGLETLRPTDQLTILRKTFADAGGFAPRVLEHLDGLGDDTAGLYFDAIGTFPNHTWTKGRVTLLGDAAYCNATVGGAGTSLGLIGAYVLAGELQRSDVPTALAEYQRVMRPHVDAAPPVKPGRFELINPRTTAGVKATQVLARIVAGPLGRGVMALARRRGDDAAPAELRLPEYGEAVAPRPTEPA